MRFRGASAAIALTLAACASDPVNPLIGEWVVDLPTTPRAHGNEIGFFEHCLVVRGDRINVRIAKPVRYVVIGSGALVWYGPDAETPGPGDAARVRFLSADRIEVRWPEGVTARYLRGVAQRDEEEAAALCGVGKD